jgi:hypothetical protein
MDVDSTGHEWSVQAGVHNRLAQSVGTPDGSTRTGIEAIVTSIRVTRGNGSVLLTNPDGIAGPADAKQPYIEYDQIVAPDRVADRRWRFTVAGTVTAISVLVSIAAEFPAQQTVGSVAEGTMPNWVHADSNIAGPTDSVGVRFTKRIVLVRFRPTASLREQQLAIAMVNGMTVGENFQGLYYVQVPYDREGQSVFDAIRTLESLPQVLRAYPEILLEPL